MNQRVAHCMTGGFGKKGAFAKGAAAAAFKKGAKGGKKGKSKFVMQDLSDRFAENRIRSWCCSRCRSKGWCRRSGRLRSQSSEGRQSSGCRRRREGHRRRWPLTYPLLWSGSFCLTGTLLILLKISITESNDLVSYCLLCLSYYVILLRQFNSTSHSNMRYKEYITAKAIKHQFFLHAYMSLIVRDKVGLRGRTQQVTWTKRDTGKTVSPVG